MADPAGRSIPNVVRPGTVSAPDFPAGLDWLNTSAPISIRQLRGKVVLLDFWTHCCINCMHALEDLKRLERKYRDELVVIGVHSAKFDGEKSTASVRQAVLRNGIEHPVVNDREMRVWQEYAVRAWPSFILIDPRGKVFGTHSGEGIFDLFDRVLVQLIQHYEAEGDLRRGPSEVSAGASAAPPSVLAFPGKVLADSDGRRLFIADTNHHRIVVASLDDRSVLDVFGSGEAGLADGTPDAARFTSPQGMALAGQTLFVADTGNHAVRAVDLSARRVSTVVGDGRQDEGRDGSPGPLAGRRLNSPWDLEFAHGVLFVAMAGSHQIYGIDMEGGYIAAHAGDGREDHTDGPLLAASLAQPTGLTSDGEHLFVADSEVSSVRAVSLDPRGGHVRTVVGRGLFDFGDVDGQSQAVRLQHPMGIAWASGALHVADTYNHKVKAIELPGLRARTMAGSGEAGFRDGPPGEARFDEPAGLTAADGSLYVADTNNHAIREVDLASGAVSSWTLRELARLAPPAGQVRELRERTVRAGALRLAVRCELPSGHAYMPGARSGVTARVGGRAFPAVLRDGTAVLTVEVDSGSDLQVEAVVYYCGLERSGACLIHREALAVPLRIAPHGASDLALRLVAGAPERQRGRG